MTKYRIKVDTLDGKSTYTPEEYREFKGSGVWSGMMFDEYKTEKEARKEIIRWKEIRIERERTVTTFIDL